MTNTKSRCSWCPTDDKVYGEYHDTEWGVPVYDDQELFRMLILEGAHAGLSWRTVLVKRSGYDKIFHSFDVDKVVNMTDADLERALTNPQIIRNRLKVFSVRKNAQVFLEIQKEYGSFSEYLWHYVAHTPIINHWKNTSQVPTKTELSDTISKDLKKRGMSFVGSTIIYAYLQAVGVVNDHTRDCFRYQPIIDAEKQKA